MLFSLTAQAVEPQVVSVSKSYENIGKQVTLLKDERNVFTLEEVIRMADEGRFLPSTEAILNLGNSTSAFWIKLRYKNSGTQGAYLVVDVPNIEHIDFYTVDIKGRIIQMKTGSLSEPNADVLATNNYIFDLPPTGAIQQGRDVYLKVRSNNIMLLALKIADAKTLMSSSNYKVGFESVYSGILIMLLIFNIFLFITIKDRTYLYYSVYIAALFTYVVLYLRGYSYILGPELRIFINLYPHVFASLATIAAFFFSWEFLGIRSRVPKMVPVYKLMGGLWIILLTT
jgi:hypothetical protein